jgi:dsRNA-specific ribonuclease
VKIYDKRLAEYKRKELIGDALLLFIAREMLLTDYNDRIKQGKTIQRVTCNKLLEKVAKKIGLKPFHPDKKMEMKKPYADAVEVKIYDIYLEGGIEAAKAWFTENIFKNYTPSIFNKKKK